MRNGVSSCDRVKSSHESCFAASLVRVLGILSFAGSPAALAACAGPHDLGGSPRDTGAERESGQTDNSEAESGPGGELREQPAPAEAKDTESNTAGQGQDAKEAKNAEDAEGPKEAPAEAPNAMAATPAPAAPSGDALPEPSDAADPSSSAGAAGSGDAALPPTTSGPAQCEPRGGRYVVLEQEALTVNLSCAIAGAAPSSWVLEVVPAGARFDAATGALSWRPALDQAASYTLTARAMPWAEVATLDIAVVDRVEAQDNQPLVDPTQYHEEYGLPVLHLNTDPGVNDDEYTPAMITYRGHTYVGSEAKYRGATSKSYPKRSFTLKFTKEDKFGDPDRAGGFLKKRKVTLITSFDDNSYVRQRLGYELWNRFDPNGHIRVQAYNVVVYLNGEYHGLYTLADHIDGFLMEDFGYDQDGNLYKARSYDANWRRSSGVAFTPEGEALPKDTLHDGFTKEEGTPEDGQPGAWDDLDAFVAWAADSSGQEFARTIDSTISRKEYEDWWIWVSYIAAADSAGKNSYHYRDPLRADSVWHCVPWDLNASFGQDWQTLRTDADSSPPDAWYRYVNNLFDRILSDPDMGPLLEARYGEELQGPLASDVVTGLFDGILAEIEESARRDEQKWQDDYRSYMLWRQRTDFTTFQQEAAYVRRWISERHAYLDAIY